MAPQPSPVITLPTPSDGPVFRRCDWLAGGIAFAIAMIGYICMLAPNVTLEDSGELITAAHNLGVPHPPGYPIWTVLGFLFDHLNPLSPYAVPAEVKDVTRRAFNIAWRVNLMSATFGALTVGLLGLLISRSGSMLIRSVKTLSESVTESQEQMIVSVCGTVGALIFAFSPTPLSQAVVGEVYTLNGLFMVATMTTMFTWMWHQNDKYLYWTCFLWGLGLTNHQTLLFMAAAYFIFVALINRHVLIDLIVGACWVAGIGVWFMEWILDSNTEFFRSAYFWRGFGLMVAPLIIALACRVITQFGHPITVNWKRAGIVASCVLGGLSFYAYSPLASMTNPPMNWGFTRDKDGFWHHITRGQYEKVKVERPLGVFFQQLMFFGKDLILQYTSLLVAGGISAVLWFFKSDSRSKKWLTFIAAGFFFTSFTFIVLANPTLDRAVRVNDRVFFLPTHALFCACIGYALIFGTSYLLRHIATWRWLLFGGSMFFCLAQLGYQFMYHRGHTATADVTEWYWAGLQVFIVFAVGMLLLFTEGNYVPLRRTLVIVALLPLVGLFRNWKDNEMHNHMFGWYFGYHMFEPGGGYPPMAKNAILYGGTDPGRFVPTYEIFCPRVHPDVYIITQNALAENTYLRYLRYQYASVRKKDDFNWIEQALGRDTVYPKEDIYISNDEDSAAAIRAYVEELQHRPALPGEQVSIVGGRVNIQGVQAVTALNGLISKQIFDKERDKHEFYVEESFVINWMYNYLEPFGIIMKINHDPKPRITPEQVALNRQYWKNYIAKHLNSDMFRRDDDAQRAFSKLRTAHAGLYAWRATLAPPEQRQPELANEADHAFKEALELCPYNVEATFRYAEFMTRLERYDDAIKIVEQYKPYDPQNPQIPQVLNQINGLRNAASQEMQLRQYLQANPGNLDGIMQFLSVLANRGKFPEMDANIDKLIERRDLPVPHFKTIAQTYVQLNRWDRVKLVLTKYLSMYPDDAQSWYDLAVVLIQLQQADPALDALDRAIRLNPAFKQQAQGDQRFQLIKLFPRFQQLTQ